MYTCYTKIIETIKEKLPETKIYLLAYYPVQEEMVKTYPSDLKYRDNARVKDANETVVKRIAEEQGVTYLDVCEGLFDETGSQKKEFAVDGIHMYANGYQVVFQNLKPILKEICQ